MSLFDLVRLRDDVAAGALTEAMFAASLEEVATGTARGSYGVPEDFFAGTHPSAGLRTLLDQACGRLSGARPDAASVVRLETSLGGGKTHNLIALYYAAQGRLPAALAKDFMDVDAVPAGPVQVGVFVGTAAGARSFPETHGITPSTPWGHLALQVGGPGAFEHVRGDDEAGTAPGSDDLKAMIGESPTLFLMDEIARYYEVARGHKVGDSNVASQTTAFLMALMEAVDALPRAVLVLTTTSVTDAFGEDTAEVLAAMAEASALMARKEIVLRPSEEADLPRILARRLFQSIPPGTAGPVAEAYAAAAEAASGAGLELPDSMIGTGWAARVASHYPFHPSLVTVLDKRLSTIPNFHRTRGALRLLARSLRRLWEEQPEGTELIHLHHIDLAEPHTAEELSSRLDRAAYEPVIRADIASQPGGEASHAERVDQGTGSPFARRLATSIYLYSLTRETPGVTTPELYGAVLAPGDDPNLLVRSLDGLRSASWYLHDDLRGLRFSTEASLVKLIQEAEEQISVTAARTRATAILTEQFRDGVFKVRRAWEDAKVPDNADDAVLVILHWDDFGDARGVEPKAGVPARIRDLFERTPTQGVREYRNRLVFLAPSIGTHDAMVRSVRTHLALRALKDDAETLGRLTPERRAELSRREQESLLLARVAVCNHVNVLYVPQAPGLEAVELDVVTQASVKVNQGDAILERLASMDKTLAAGAAIPDPAYIRTKLGTLLDSSLPTAELVRAFARRTDLRLVLDRERLVGLVAAGVRNGVWEYQDPDRGAEGWATAEHPALAVRLGEDVFLHPPGTAPPRAATTCPLCGGVHPGRGCPTQTTVTAGTAGTAGRVFTGTGAASKPFTDARTAAADAGRQRVHTLTVSVEHTGPGAGVELTRLHSVVRADTLGASIIYDLDATAVLTSPEDSATVRFHGPPSDFTPLRDALRQLLGPRQATLKARVVVTFEPPLELSGEIVASMVKAAADTGPSHCTVSLLTEEAS